MDLFKNKVELDISEIADTLNEILVPAEIIRQAYKLGDDTVIFSDLRILKADKQGAKLKRLEFTTIPYKSIKYFKKEIISRSSIEILIFLSEAGEPVRLKTKHDYIAMEIYQVLSKNVLRI